LTLESVRTEVLQAQLRQITNPANHQQIDTRIVPSETLLARTIEPFVIYETAEKVFTVVLRHEHATIYLSDLATVKRYKATFDALQRKAVAYAPVESC
jgi:hypothetical protein